MASTCFDVDVVDGIARIVMCRPEKRNSMTQAFWDELPALVREIDGAAKARVIVIASSGPHFSAGLDISMLEDDTLGIADATLRAEHAARLYQTIKRMQRTFSCLEHCRLPVLAAIQGGCIGGAVDLVTACDMRYASEDAYMVIEETNLALTADVGTFPRICRLVNDGLARELAFTGRRLSAAEAREVGLVNRVFPDHESLIEGVMAIAGEVASKAPLALWGAKRMLNYARDHRTDDALDYVALWNAGMLELAEIREAMRSRREGRAGRFAPLPPLGDGDC